jgi:hypothetical protein
VSSSKGRINLEAGREGDFGFMVVNVLIVSDQNFLARRKPLGTQLVLNPQRATVAKALRVGTTCAPCVPNKIGIHHHFA